MLTISIHHFWWSPERWRVSLHRIGTLPWARSSPHTPPRVSPPVASPADSPLDPLEPEASQVATFAGISLWFSTFYLLDFRFLLIYTQKKSNKLHLPQHDLACESFHGTGGPCCPFMAWFGSENWVYTLKCHQINDNDDSINPWVFSGQPIFRPTLFSTSGNQVTARSSFSTTGVDSIRSTTSIWYLGKRPGMLDMPVIMDPKWLATGGYESWCIMILIPIYPPRFCQSNLVTIYSIHSLIFPAFLYKGTITDKHIAFFPFSYSLPGINSFHFISAIFESQILLEQKKSWVNFMVKYG